MAQTIEIKTTCSACGGTGVQPVGVQGSTQPCQMCGGSGKLVAASVVLDPGLDDVMDKVNDVLDKCEDILEKLNE